MKLGIFTDPHYSSQEVTCGNRYNNQSLRKIKEACDAFRKASCDLVVCLGDLTDAEDSHAHELENLREIAAVFSALPIPVVCVMGNHDAFAFTEEEFYGVLSSCCPTNRTVLGKRLIFLDACFFKNGRHYVPGDSDWTDTFLPDPAALQAALQGDPIETYIFLHQNVDPAVREDHRLYNAAEIAQIIETSGIVKTVFQGHYHPGQYSERNGVTYRTLPAMCEAESRYYIFDL